MKHILTKNSFLISTSCRHFILIRPDIKWEVSKSTLTLLSHFLEPTTIQDVLCKYGDNKKTEEIIFRFLKQGILIRKVDDKSEFLKNMLHQSSNKHFSIYSDTNQKTFESNGYCESLEHILKLTPVAT